MYADIVKIGNSRGLRIPKTLLEQCKLKGRVELKVDEGTLIIQSTRKPRQGWDESFEKMRQNQHDALLDKPESTEWDQKEWEW